MTRTTFPSWSRSRIAIDLTSELLQMNFDQRKTEDLKIRWGPINLVADQLLKFLSRLCKFGSCACIFEERHDSESLSNVLFDSLWNPTCELFGFFGKRRQQFIF